MPGKRCRDIIKELRAKGSAENIAGMARSVVYPMVVAFEYFDPGAVRDLPIVGLGLLFRFQNVGASW